MIVLDTMKLESGKTKEAIQVLTNLKVNNEKTLIVVNELDENLVLATRNLANVILLETDEINTLDVVSADRLVITEDAVKKIEEVLA